MIFLIIKKKKNKKKINKIKKKTDCLQASWIGNNIKKLSGNIYYT